MNWDMIFMGSVILTCTTMGIIIGAWFAARGFEKVLISLMKDYNEKEG